MARGIAYCTSWLFLLFFVLSDACGGQQEVTRELMEVYCFDCHNGKKKEGQVRLDDLGQLSPENSSLWTKVFEQVSLGQMPPEDQETFSPAEKERFLKGIAQDFEAKVKMITPGSRRLNRREFSAALQDLTGLAIDFGAALPADGKVDGFDTGAAGLKDTAETVERMLEVTRRAVDGIRFLEHASPRLIDLDFREHDFTDFRKFIDQRYKEKGVFTKSKRLMSRKGEGLFLNTEWSGDRGSSFLAIPVPADENATLRFTFRVKGYRPVKGLPSPILWVKIGGKYLDYQTVPDEGLELSYDVRVEDCLVDEGVVKLMLRSVVEMPYSVEGFENDDRSKPGEVPGGIGIYRPKYDRKKLRLPEEKPIPATIVEWVRVDDDFCIQWPSGLMRVSDSDESAKGLLSLWIKRAWRRPVKEQEILKFLTLYQKLRGEGKSFDDALRATFQAVLMTLEFRDHIAPIGDHAGFALASRVAFLLTGRPPDEKLKNWAADGAVYGRLGREIERLLADSRSTGFFEPFVNQWLVLDQPVTVTMSHLQKQDFRFGRHLKASMKREPVEYFRALFLENRPAREIVSSDWTMANDILARYYGIPGVEGGTFRKVTMKEAVDPRGGGIPGQAGIQSMLTWMGDNWVIYRGAWTLHRILDDPPPAPPLEIPELNPGEGKNRGKSFRELLKVHLKDERCASCHKNMDSLGFAFQNFDLSGRWREVEHQHYNRKELDGKIEWRGTGKTHPVDAKGHLPRGEGFSSYLEFRELLAKNYETDIIRGILKKLTLYGTGRSPNVLDLKAIDEILERNRKDGARMQDVLKDLLTSPIFLDHQNPNF